MASKLNNNLEKDSKLNVDTKLKMSVVLKAKRMFSSKKNEGKQNKVHLKPDFNLENPYVGKQWKLDMLESKPPDSNITIHNFDTKGLLINPVAPTVSTAIDPDYLNDTKNRKSVHKFLLGTDIIKLREMARNKYMLWYNKNLQTQKYYENELHNKQYMEMKEFISFCNERLDEMQRESFKELRETQIELENLDNNSLTIKRRQLELDYQKISMEVLRVFNTFKYLLKLINYFDQVSDEIDENNKLQQILNTNNFEDFLLKFPSNHSQNELKELTYFIDDIIVPYLDKLKNFDADLWYKGYQKIEEKIFKYTEHLTRVALLNHTVEIIYDKFMKSHELKTKRNLQLKNSDGLKIRSDYFETRSRKMFNEWEQAQKLDKVPMRIEANSDALIKKLDVYDAANEVTDPTDILRNVTYEETEQETNLYTKIKVNENIGRIQNCLFILLNELDIVPLQISKKCERLVRKKMIKDEIQAKKSLLEECRIKNLIHHFEHHQRTDY